MNAAAPDIRVRSTRLGDLEALERLISEYTHDGTLLPRTRANLVHHVRDFRVAIVNGRLAGCGALQVADANLAEVRTLAVDSAWRGRGIGRRILETLLRDARRLGLPRVFCLTRQPEFFARHGFVEKPKERFPEKVWNDCRLCPRRHGCDEIAMERELRSRAALRPSAPTAGESYPLRHFLDDLQRSKLI